MFDEESARETIHYLHNSQLKPNKYQSEVRDIIKMINPESDFQLNLDILDLQSLQGKKEYDDLNDFFQCLYFSNQI